MTGAPTLPGLRPERLPAERAGGAPLGRVVALIALACGLAVANLYYAQPLLEPIARAFRVRPGSAATVVTATQLGYAAGLVLLVPLGDLVENRRLITRILLGTAVALAAAAAAPTLGLFLAASAAIGLTSVVAQVLVPLAAHLAPAERRGQVVGLVMGGLLLGVLLGRSAASLLAAAASWRAIYLVSAAAMLLLAGALHRLLPVRVPQAGPGYPALLRSLGTLVRTERVLRWRSGYQAAMFGAFSLFWSSVALELARTHHLSQAQIGVFALVGAAGAGAAPLVGRIADRGLGHPATGAGLALGSAALVLAGLGHRSLVLLGLAAVLLDFAVQMTMVVGQRAVFGVRPEARSRMNTVYIATFFLGGAAGSALSGALYTAGGWPAVALAGAVLPLAGLSAWILAALRQCPV